METPPAPPRAHPSLLRRAATFYGIVTLFAVGFAVFSEHLSVLFGEKPLEWKGLAAALGIGLALVGLTRLGARAWKPMERAALAGAALLGPITVPEALGLAALSGIAEELLFRGALWPTLHLTGTTLLFGLVHIVPRLDLWLWPLFALVAGLAMGLVRDGSGNVLPSMLVHVLVNGANLLWMSKLSRARVRAAAAAGRAARWADGSVRMTAAPPRPRFTDHLRVLGLLARTVLSGLPFVLFALVGPVLRRVLRARLRARLERGELDPPAEPPLPDPARWAGKTVFVVAGEPSGDRLAAPVVAALRRLCPDLRLRGYAGPACRAAGVALDRDLTSHAVVGVVAVARSLPTWWRLCAEFLAMLRETPPDLLLTIDYPGLNGRLAGWAHRRGVRTVHLVAPGLWAYAGWRLGRWRRAVDHLLALFPFEPALFAGTGLPTTYVGHPLFAAPLPPPRTAAAWPGAGPCTVEVLPGSREGELLTLTPLLLEAAARVERSLPGARFSVRLADEAHRARFEEGAALARARPTALDVVVGVRAPAAPLLAALASSGTVTAELAAALVPMSVSYRVTRLARFGAELWLTAPYICLANLLAGRRIVPERVVTLRSAAARLADDFLAVAGDAAVWTRQRADLAVVRRRLETPHVADRAARAVLAGA